MRKAIFTATCAAALAAAAPAYAAGCDDGWTALNDTYVSNVKEGATGELRGHVQDAMRLAAIFDRAGYSDTCEDIVEGLKTIAEDPEAQERFVTSAGEVDNEYGFRREAREMENEAEAEMAEWKKDLEEAVEWSALKKPISADQLESMDVHNFNGEDIGAVDNVLIAEDKATHLIVGHGGFLGIGDTEVAIPISKARFNVESETVYIDVTEEQMDRAPDFDMEDYEADADAWTKENDEYWVN